MGRVWGNILSAMTRWTWRWGCISGSFYCSGTENTRLEPWVGYYLYYILVSSGSVGRPRVITDSIFHVLATSYSVLLRKRSGNLIVVIVMPQTSIPEPDRRSSQHNYQAHIHTALQSPC